MKRILLLVTACFIIAVLASCAAAPQASQSVGTEMVPAMLASPDATAAETQSAPTGMVTQAPTNTAPPSTTPLPTATFGPTPTETLLPTLELPTLAAVEPASQVWDGVPTYLADSQPGFYFRLTYDPRLWAQVQDSFGQPALGHRAIEYCILAPGGVRGMPPGVQVEHDLRKIGNLFFEINVALQLGTRQFITYQATDTVIFTSFQLNFVDRVDDCIADAEVVLGTLTSVPQDQATPVP